MAAPGSSSEQCDNECPAIPCDDTQCDEFDEFMDERAERDEIIESEDESVDKNAPPPAAAAAQLQNALPQAAAAAVQPPVQQIEPEPELPPYTPEEAQIADTYGCPQLREMFTAYNESMKNVPGFKKIPFTKWRLPVLVRMWVHRTDPNYRLKPKGCCAHGTCMVIAVFNFDGQPKGLYCNTHKEPTMINVVDKHRGCDCGSGVRPSIGPSLDKPIACANCRARKEKASGCTFISVVGRYCFKCQTRATFWNVTFNQPACKAHQGSTCVDIMHPICGVVENGVKCQIRASFGDAKTGPIRCAKHGGEYINLACKWCEKCKQTIASFGFIRGKPTRCQGFGCG